MTYIIGFLLGVMSTSAAWLMWQLLRYPPLRDVSLPRDLPGGLRAYSCTRWESGVPYGVVLYSTSAAQIERDFPGVQVEGRYIGEYQ